MQEPDSRYISLSRILAAGLTEIGSLILKRRGKGTRRVDCSVLLRELSQEPACKFVCLFDAFSGNVPLLQFSFDDLSVFLGNVA